MNNGIQIFSNSEFGSVRSLVINENPWFLGKDICSVFGDKNHNRSIGRVDEEDKRIEEIVDAIGRKQKAIFVNESGLYSLLFSMQPQKANKGGVSNAYPIEIKDRIEKLHRFKHWVTSEVLPTIRKTGGYVNNEDLFINTYLPFADDNTKTLFRATLSTINQLNTKIEKDKPLVEFAEHIQASEDCISMNDMAKLASKQGVKIGRNNLFKLLREKKILKADNVPYQRYIEQQPWFQVKESTYENANVTHLTLTTMVTAQGQKGIIKMLKKGC